MWLTISVVWEVVLIIKDKNTLFLLFYNRNAFIETKTNAPVSFLNICDIIWTVFCGIFIHCWMALFNLCFSDSHNATTYTCITTVSFECLHACGLTENCISHEIWTHPCPWTTVLFRHYFQMPFYAHVWLTERLLSRQFSVNTVWMLWSNNRRFFDRHAPLFI